MSEDPRSICRYAYSETDIRYVEPPVYICGGTNYIQEDIHKRRVDDLLETTNRYLERARKAEAKLKEYENV